MKRNNNFSDEILNAYIDNELSHDERKQILSALRHDKDLTRRICDLQKVRGLVQLAFADETLPNNQPNKINTPVSTGYRFVAGILLIFGVFIGWFANQAYRTESDHLKLAEHIRKTPETKNNNVWHVMLHVSNNDPRRFDVLLSETEYLLQSHKEKNQAIEIELLANGKGIDLLQDGTSAQAEKLIMLTNKFSNLKLSACGVTLERLQKESGQQFVLLPKTKIVRSAIYQVTKRQKEGWSYIRI